MDRKRKLPARAARVESISKKRNSTTPELYSQTPTPPAPPPPIEETLPRSIASGKPLPTVEEPQPDSLSANQFQTIPESGVLVESLHRSRKKWLSEGIFEKYWTKPIKKKGAPEQPPDNPSKDSMTKLGSCTITVEPHIFEATMYAIKDPNPRPQIPPTSQQPMYRPIIQYGPPGGIMPPIPLPPAAAVQAPVQQKPPPPPASQPTPASQDVHMSNTSQLPPPTDLLSLNGSAANHTSTPNQHPAPATNPPPPAPPAARGKSTDPVIQMLAERAATDSNLKSLMRIVANGEATATELKQFQSHIDELTRLQKARQAAEGDSAGTPPPPPPSQQTSSQAGPSHTNGNTNPHKQHPPATSTPTQKFAPQPKAAPAPQYQAPPQPQALRSKGPVPSKSDITGIAFEFSGGNGDRYSFPRFSILESRPGGEVIASFLIVRKGSSSDSPTYDPELDYYQPITIRLFAQQARQLDALQKVVAPPDEVRRYMDDIMDSATRAEYVLLAMRLPKDVEQQTLEMEAEAEKADQMDYITAWPTTNSHSSTPVPMPKIKAQKKLLTEEEQYQSFIATVAPVV